MGEYSAIPSTPPKNDNTNTLIAAVAEASFALSLERNADVVKATAFAPVLANVGGSQWPHVLLKFDSDRLVRTPSYYALQMLRNSLGTHTVRQAARGGIDTWSASVSVLEGDGKTVAVKLANYCASSQQVEVKLHDAQILRLDATTMAPDTAMALWGAPNYLGKAQEYVSRPERNESDVVEEVAPRPLQVNTTQAELNGGRVRVTLPGWSFSVVQVVLR